MKPFLKKDKKILSAKDYIVSKETYNLYLDLKTKIVWTEINKQQNLNKYYENANYIPHNKKIGLLSILYKISQNIMFSYKYKVLQKKLQSSRLILDYGSGDGQFAGYLQKKNIYVHTYDPIIKNQNKMQLTNNQYDMIMLWHVLEHILDIQAGIFALRKKLKKSGVIVVAVPNRDSYDSKVYKKYWAAWDVPRHLYHFNHISLIDFMKNNGFSLISKHPLFLDSYYISYLSSKNKNSFFPWINSLIIGTISNILGAITSKYSSSFYVFEKD